MIAMTSIERKRQKGNSLVEFALVSVFLVPLLIGTVHIGMNITRSIQVTQVSRDAGHMFARYVDFSLVENQDMIVRLAEGLGMTRTGGTGKVTLSQIMFVGQDQCTAGGLSLAQCTNYNQPVIIRRLAIGSNSLTQSTVGTPNSGLLDSKGNVSNYLRESSARATGFNSVLQLQAGEFAYVSEAYFRSPLYDFPTTTTGTALFARTIF
jgi:Flp pilus assembly protein TadG